MVKWFRKWDRKYVRAINYGEKVLSILENSELETSDDERIAKKVMIKMIQLADFVWTYQSDGTLTNKRLLNSMLFLNTCSQIHAFFISFLFVSIFMLPELKISLYSCCESKYFCHTSSKYYYLYSKFSQPKFLPPKFCEVRKLFCSKF